MAVTPPTFEEWNKNLENYLYSTDFVQSPNIYEVAKNGVGGWKIHVGLGIRNPHDPTERKKIVEVLQEVTELIRKYDKEVGAKFAGFKLMEAWSDYNNPQRGKQITIYVPEEHAYLVPTIARHLEYILEKHRAKGLTLIGSEPGRNIFLDKDGVISLRWSSYFSPRPGREEEIDDQERYQNALEVARRVGKYQELQEIYKMFKKLENARYLDRSSVIDYLRRGEIDKLKGNIVAIPFENEGGITYYTYLVEDIVYNKEGRPKLIVRGLEGPYRWSREVDIDKISRNPEKTLRHKILEILALILIPISLLVLSSNIFNISNISGSFILTNQSVFFSFISTFLISLVIIGYKRAKK